MRILPSAHDGTGTNGARRNGSAPVHANGSGATNGGVRADGLGQPIRVLVADDHDAYRAGLVRALGQYPHVTVAGEASTGELACEAVIDLRPDVVLLDLTIPGMDGLAAAARIRDAMPAARVVLLTSLVGPRLEQAELGAGVAGVLSKTAPLDDVVGVILAAAQNAPPGD